MENPPDYMPALVTPFTSRGELDIAAHKRNVKFLAERGIEGFVIAGSNGEGPYLDPGERKRLVSAVRRRKVHLMVGVMAQTVRQAMAQIEEAHEAGADSALVLTPTAMARGRDQAQLDFFKTIADKSKLPVYLYSVPMVSAYTLPLELVVKLSKHDNIPGMKDSSGDVVRLQSIVEQTPNDFMLYSGSSPALSAALTVGCYGAITGSGNYAPALVRQTMDAVRSSSPDARRLQKKLSRLSKDVESLGVPGVKAASKAAGLEPGYPRQPLKRLPRGQETSIAKLIA